MIAAEPRGDGKPSLNEALSWIGSRVDDIYGACVGRLEDVWIDPGSGAPRWLLVKEGRFGGRATLIPFEDATAGAGQVWIPHERDVVREAPEVEPGAPLTQGLEAELRNHYARAAAPADSRAGYEAPAAASGSGLTGAAEPDWEEPSRRHHGHADPAQARPHEHLGRAPTVEQGPPAPPGTAPHPPADDRRPPQQHPHHGGWPGSQGGPPPMRPPPPPPRPAAPQAAAHTAPRQTYGQQYHGEERQQHYGEEHHGQQGYGEQHYGEQPYGQSPPQAPPPYHGYPQAAPAPPPFEPPLQAPPPSGWTEPAPRWEEQWQPPPPPAPRGPAEGAPQPPAGGPTAPPDPAGRQPAAIPYRVEIELEGEVRISGELKSFRLTPARPE